MTLSSFILDISNKINFGDGAVEVDSQKVRDRYEEFLRLIAKEDKFQSKLVKQLDNDVDKVIAIQQDLEDDGPYTDTFKTWLKDQDIYLKEEVKVTDDKDKVTETTKKVTDDKDKVTTTNKIKVVTEKGVQGISRWNEKKQKHEFTSWEQLEKENKIEILPEYLKIEYNKYKEGSSLIKKDEKSGVEYIPFG